MLKEMTGEGCTIEDTDLLHRLRQKSTGALEEAVRQYGAYVMAIIRNRSRGVLIAWYCITNIYGIALRHVAACR